MLKRGVYAASLSVLNKDLTLNVEATISHAENLIKNGLHGCFFFGSTGMSQLISKNENDNLKKALDIWLFVCQLFTFVALVEYAVVNVRTRLEQETNKRLKLENEDSKVRIQSFHHF